MWGIIDKISNVPKNYLERVGFTLQESKAKFVVRLWGDGISAVLFAAISIILICLQIADMIVLTLNILCLFRVMINTTISASLLTCRNHKNDIENKTVNYKYYHIKGVAYVAGFVIIALAWVFLWWSKGESGILIKLFSIIAILAVLFNDLENDFVCAYNAVINPIV